MEWIFFDMLRNHLVP